SGLREIAARRHLPRSLPVKASITSAILRAAPKVRIPSPAVLPRVSMRFKHLAVLSLVLSLAACGPGGGHDKGAKGHGGPGGGMPPAEVNVSTVQSQTLPVTLEYTGQTAGSREVEVRARVTGILVSRNFREGAQVKQGQSLFTIDPAPFEAALARAQADVAAAEARVDQ